MEPATMPSDEFLSAFSASHGSCRMTCACGREHYDSSVNGWDWEPGELEALQADEKAIGHDCSVESIMFNGEEYVMDCPCTKTLTIFEDILKRHPRACATYLCTMAEKRAQKAKNIQHDCEAITKELRKNVLM